MSVFVDTAFARKYSFWLLVIKGKLREKSFILRVSKEQIQNVKKHAENTT